MRNKMNMKNKTHKCVPRNSQIKVYPLSRTLSVEDWRQLVESIYIDWNYDGQTMRPTICDIPTKDELVSGIYKIPDSAGKIKIKITDLLSESLELEV